MGRDIYVQAAASDVFVLKIFLIMEWLLLCITGWWTSLVEVLQGVYVALPF